MNTLNIDELKATILLVDDIPGNLIAIEAVLVEMKENLVSVSSGSEALRYLLEHDDVAVILLDVQMPGMDGYETAGFIRGREQSRRLPIIFLTAINKSDMQIERGYAEGAVDYLFKPFNPFILKSKVSVFVELYKAHERSKRKDQEIATLQRLLPLCAWCKKMRSDDGYWRELEEFVVVQKMGSVTHGICDECAKKIIPKI